MGKKRLVIDFRAFTGALVLTCTGAFVFFDAIYGLIPAAAVGVYGYRVLKESSASKKRLKKISELKSLMISVQTTLEAGKSLENSFIYARQELIQLYGKRNEMVKALEKFEKKISLNYTLNKALDEFAREVDIAEAYDFVDVITTIKRTGGNAVKIIKDSVERMVNEMELREELSTMVAAKKLELMVMVTMPSLITLFLRYTNEGFLDPLYGNIPGVTVMMGLNVLAYHMGRKIVDIY